MCATMPRNDGNKPMTGLPKPARILTAFALAVCAAATMTPVRAAELCGWLTETSDANSVHQFTLWLEADTEVALFYKMSGKGIVTEGMKAYSPGSGSFSLHPKKAEKPWGFGTSLSPPGDIDIVAEIHVPPKSIFDEEAPLLAKFTFQRHVPEEEKAPPNDFAHRQCVTLAAGR
jgi:hypothetical protein